MLKQFTVLLVIALSAFGCSSYGGNSSSVTSGTENRNNIAAAGEVRNISVAEAGKATAKNGVQFIDVRTVDEFNEGHAKSAVNIPIEVLDESLSQLEKDQPIYVICRIGTRSAVASEILKKNGFTEIYNIKGGTADWAAAKLPLE